MRCMSDYARVADGLPGAAALSAAQGDDCADYRDGPVHVRLLELLPDHRLAAGFRDAAAYEQAAGEELVVSHAGALFRK